MTLRCLTPVVVLCVVVMSASALVASVIPADSILVAQRSGNIVVLDLNGNSLGTFTPGGTTPDIVEAVQISNAGEIVAADQKGRFSRYDGGGVYTGVYGNVPAAFNGQGATVGANGSVYVSEQLTDTGLVKQVARLNPATGLQEASLAIVDSGGVKNSNGIRDITTGPDGYLYAVAFDYNGSTTVRKIAPDLSASSVFARSSYATAGNKGSSLAFGPDGDLYVALYGLNEVERFDGTSGLSQGLFVTAGSGGLTTATGMMFHPDTGNLLVGSFGTDQILEYNGSTGAYVGVFATVLDPFYFNQTVSTPEPMSSVLLGTGLMGLLAYAWRKRKQLQVVQAD